jgi:hypothetical protein
MRMSVIAGRDPQPRIKLDDTVVILKRYAPGLRLGGRNDNAGCRGDTPC